jgi:hypothetical protein
LVKQNLLREQTDYLHNHPYGNAYLGVVVGCTLLRHQHVGAISRVSLQGPDLGLFLATLRWKTLENSQISQQLTEVIYTVSRLGVWLDFPSPSSLCVGGH